MFLITPLIYMYVRVGSFVVEFVIFETIARTNVYNYYQKEI